MYCCLRFTCTNFICIPLTFTHTPLDAVVIVFYIPVHIAPDITGSQFFFSAAIVFGIGYACAMASYHSILTTLTWRLHAFTYLKGFIVSSTTKEVLLYPWRFSHLRNTVVNSSCNSSTCSCFISDR